MILQYSKYHVLSEVKRIEKIYEKKFYTNIHIVAFITRLGIFSKINKKFF